MGVVETEKQVMKLLEKHLQRMLQQMYEDKARHTSITLEHGAAELPETIKKVMKIFEKIMTTPSY